MLFSKAICLFSASATLSKMNENFDLTTFVRDVTIAVVNGPS